jgi:hypothetical protein
MTVTRMQKQYYLNFWNFWISKDIVWASGLNINYVRVYVRVYARACICASDL